MSMQDQVNRLELTLGDLQAKFASQQNEMESLKAANQQLVNKLSLVTSVPADKPSHKQKDIIDCKGFSKVDTFTGGQGKFNVYSRKLLSVVCGVKPFGKKWMQWAEKQPHQITGNTLAAAFGIAGTPENVEMIRDFSADLINALILTCDDEPADIVNNVMDIPEPADGQLHILHGLEAWRSLFFRFRPQSDARDLIDLTQAMNPVQIQDPKKVIQAIEKWEMSLKDASESAKKLTDQDHFRKAAVVHILPNEIKSHIIKQAAQFKTYAEVKKEIIRLIDLELVQQHQRPFKAKGKDDMDIGSVDTGKGSGSADWSPETVLMWLAETYKGKGKGYGGKGDKGKGKGDQKGSKGDKGKGKGDKGKGKGEGGQFQGYCSYCEKWGHRKRECRSFERDWWNGTVKPTNLLEDEEDQDKEEDKDDEQEDLGGLNFNSLDLWEAPKRPVKPKKVSWAPVKIDLKSSFSGLACEDYDCVCSGGVSKVQESELMDGDHIIQLNEIHNVNKGKGTQYVQEKDDGYLVTFTADSGAAEIVAPSDMLPHIPKRESPGSKKGVTYGAANGGILRNEGEKDITGKDCKGHNKKVTVQLAKVTKPLYSIGKSVKTGHKIVFDDDSGEGAYILHKASGSKTPLRFERGVYVFDLLIPKSGFKGRGQ